MGRPAGSLNKTKSPTWHRREARKAARIASGKPPRRKRREQFALDLELPIVAPADRPQRPKSARGRKSILIFNELTLQRLWAHGVVQSTQEEAAEALGVSRETLRIFFIENPIAGEVFDDARAIGTGKLRSRFYSEAMNGNTPALLHAAKHLLGMKPASGEADVDEGAILEAMEVLGVEIRQRIADDAARRA
jgi:hypothetical protein